MWASAPTCADIPQKAEPFCGNPVSIPFGATELPQAKVLPLAKRLCGASAVPPAAGPREGQLHSGGRPRRAYSSVSASSSSRTSASSSGSSSAGADAGLMSIFQPSAWPPAGRSGPPRKRQGLFAGTLFPSRLGQLNCPKPRFCPRQNACAAQAPSRLRRVPGRASSTQEAAPAGLIPRSRPRRPAGRPLRPPAPRQRGRTRA